MPSAARQRRSDARRQRASMTEASAQGRSVRRRPGRSRHACEPAPTVNTFRPALYLSARHMTATAASLTASVADRIKASCGCWRSRTGAEVGRAAPGSGIGERRHGRCHGSVRNLAATARRRRGMDRSTTASAQAKVSAARRTGHGAGRIFPYGPFLALHHPGPSSIPTGTIRQRGV